ncbi:MAG: AAA-associated domain-containing protein [Bdellovibrionota bacterium]
MPNSKEFIEIEEQLEKSFGQLHLDKTTDLVQDKNILEPTNKKNPPAKEVRIKPLINTNLTLVEGLITRLNNEAEATDLYDLCENMGQSVDQVLPAVVAGETLGFIHTPGIRVVLTQEGRNFAREQDPEIRASMMRHAILTLPFVSTIYDLVKKAGEGGLDTETAIDQIVMVLPFEDHDVQFHTLLKWCRHANLLVYDSDEEKLFIPE